MLISHRKKFIYTKTVKTAGTSVESYFEKYCMPEGEWVFTGGREEYISSDGIIGYRGIDARGKKWRNHMPAKEIRNNISIPIWDSYFKFCVIRNPFDKLISGFYFFEKQKQNPKLQANRQSEISQSLDNINDEGPIERFRSWIKNGEAVIDRDKYLIDQEICVDYFIKYEELENEIKHVCGVLDVPFEPERIPKMKAGVRNREIPIRQFYDEETIEIVKRMYQFELEEFKYSIPD